MKVYVDVGRRKAHTVYFPESSQTVRLARLIELLNYAVTAVYVDALFPSVLNDLRELAKNGVKVYHLRRLSIISLLRQKHGLEKSDDDDARLLANISINEFRELTEPQISLRMLVNEYYVIADTLKQVRQKEKTIPNNGMMDTRKLLRRQQDAVGKRLLEEAGESLPHYRLVRKRLGFNGVSFAVLLTYVDFEQGFDKILRQVGRTAHHRKTRNRSRKAIRALNGLVAHSVRNNGTRYGQLYQYYRGIHGSKKKALLRVQTWILKDIHHIVAARPLREVPNLTREGLGQPEKMP